MIHRLLTILRPGPKPSIFRPEGTGSSNVGRVLGGLVVCLAVAALLSSGRLVTMAERQEYGESRDRWLAAANTLDRGAAALSLDRPGQVVSAALDRNDADDEVILGELAAGVGSGFSTGKAAAPATPTKAVPTTPTTIPPTVPPAPAVEATTTTASTTTAAPTTTEPPPTTATPTTAAPLGTVDVNRPLQILIAGDSLGEYVGSQLLYKVADRDLTDIEFDFQISSGLSRPDYFNWPARLSETMQADDRPQVVIFMIGGNDDQDMSSDGGRIRLHGDEWIGEYRKRVATMMDIVAYPGTQMIWINLPPMRDDFKNDLGRQVNTVLAEEAALRPWVSVTDVVPVLSTADGGYDQFLTAPGSDKTVKARANDGIHITLSASEWVARLVWAQIAERWVFDQNVTATTTPPTTTPASEPSTTAPPAPSTTSSG